MSDSDTASSTRAAAPNKPRRAVGLWYLFILALANLIWSGQGTAVKVLEARGWQPIAITFIPFYLTTLLLVPLLIYQRRRNPARVRPGGGDWWRFAVATLVAFPEDSAELDQAGKESLDQIAVEISGKRSNGGQNAT